MKDGNEEIELQGQPQRQVLPAGDGHQIQLLCWDALDGGPGSGAVPRAVVQIAHGMGEHALRYDRLARRLAAAGIAVMANQHRGHGDDSLDESLRGEFGAAGFDAVVSDMAQVSQHARRCHPQAPLILLGHSMGSFAAQLYALEHSGLLAGLVLTGTAATDLLAAGRGTNRKLEDSNAGIPDPRTPFDWLSRDPAEVDKYIADPRCGFTVTRASMVSIFSTCRRTAEPDAFSRLRPDLPVYLATGDRDPVNSALAWFHPLVERMGQAGLKDVSTRIYPGARHEVFNETNREQVIAELLAWIDNVIRNPDAPALPGGQQP
ncbi:alpha/beta fold hydrolase [Lacisediminimonas profundi]|uniref:alpha/beta fold hydrolase n=1 Tax=Lacisediminimonas profundi TaxID=2603856 RepID=UPI001F4FB3AC|nr:alpha/beta fold hydrolase [Lacisediminimonas profundi]